MLRSNSVHLGDATGGFHPCRVHRQPLNPQRRADLLFVLGLLVALALLAGFILCIHAGT